MRAALHTLSFCFVAASTLCACGLSKEDQARVLCPALYSHPSFEMLTYEEVSSLTDGAMGWDVIAVASPDIRAMIEQRYGINLYQIMIHTYRWSGGELVLNGNYGGSVFAEREMSHKVFFVGDYMICTTRYFLSP